ncbi:MAG: AI-2E family transporter [Bacteroidia bacterium]|nr:AI-2E family transporter [Bacteroidia bacterium]
MPDKKYRYIGGTIGVIIAGFCIWYFRTIVVYILISAVLALIGHPLVHLLEKARLRKFRLPRALCALIVLILIWAIVTSVLTIIIPLVAYEAHELSTIDIQQVRTYFQEPLLNLQNWFSRFQIAGKESMDILNYISEKIISFVNISQISNLFSVILGLFGNILVAFFAISFITFFFLKDNNMFSDAILLLTPSQYTLRIRHILLSVKKLLMRYFIGIIIDVMLIMLLVMTGMLIIGLKFQQAALIGVFAGLLNVIPYVGPLIGAFIGIAIGITANLHADFYSEIVPLIGYMVIVYSIVQLIDNLIFAPLIYSSSVKAHPLEIFLVIMIAGSLAGIKGMIIAVPTYTVLRVIAKEFLNNFKVVKKLTENV